MIPNLRLNGMCDRAATVAALALLGVLSASCEKAPLYAPTGTTIRLTANTQVLAINGTAEITASVLEAGGYAVQNGTMVTFTTSLGTVIPSEVGTTNGKATVIFNAGTQAGTAVINAYSGANSTTGSTTTGTGGATTTTGTGVTIVVGAGREYPRAHRQPIERLAARGHDGDHGDGLRQQQQRESRACRSPSARTRGRCRRSRRSRTQRVRPRRRWSRPRRRR